MDNRKNELWDEDKLLFKSMEGNYISAEEANFFKNMQYKEEYEPSLANDLILSENSNSDGIYIVREIYDEYSIGVKGKESEEVHVMNLSEALKTKLNQIGISGNDCSLLTWLRNRNYEGVMYDHNYDLM